MEKGKLNILLAGKSARDKIQNSFVMIGEVVRHYGFLSAHIHPQETALGKTCITYIFSGSEIHSVYSLSIHNSPSGILSPGRHVEKELR
jgi:hypothetical protein